MQITDLWIRNFKSIRDMHIGDIENALILVGKNDTGKTAVLDAVRAVGGDYAVREEDFHENYPNIEIMVTLQITQEDLQRFHRYGIVSTYRRYEAWYRDFQRKLPSYQEGELIFEFSVNREGRVRYSDGHQKNNSYIPRIFPHIYYMDAERNLEKFQADLLLLQEDELLKQMRSGCCMFDMAKKCNHCFSCIGLIQKKTPEELNAFEAAKLLEYKLYNLNLDTFSRRVNENFRKNGGRDEIVRAARRMAEDLETGKLKKEEITEPVFASYLDTAGIPDPDLLIRTSGELRLSNYLLWQLAYTEIYVTDCLWPDFDKEELEKAIAAYNKRDRRFGGVKTT